MQLQIQCQISFVMKSYENMSDYELYSSVKIPQSRYCGTELKQVFLQYLNDEKL